MNTAKASRRATLSALDKSGARSKSSPTRSRSNWRRSRPGWSPVRVRAEPGPARGSQPIEFVLDTRGAGADPFTIREKSRFLFP
jgi:hypothetical protein